MKLPPKAVIGALCLSLATLGPHMAVAQDAAMPSAAPQQPNGRILAEVIGQYLAADYLYPETGAKYAAYLSERALGGHYDGILGKALADKLTQDLLSVADDNHLRVRFTPPSGPASPGMGPPRMMRPAQGAVSAIEQPGWIAPNIAFIRFNEFPDDENVTQQALRFMQAHKDAKTIIFDLRTNRGGGAAQMDVIFPYLFAKPTKLVMMAKRGAATKDMPLPASLRPASGEPGFVTYEHWVEPGPNTPLTSAKIYVLTANKTGSAGEHFAAALKWSGRATVIGAPTAGANHFGAIHDLGGGMSVFIPEGRTYNPETGEDWEGKGITPDQSVAPQDALRIALEQSGVAAKEAANLSAAYAPTTSMEKPKIRH